MGRKEGDGRVKKRKEEERGEGREGEVASWLGDGRL